MRKLVVLIGVLSLIVSFQNCAPQNQSSPMSGEAPATYEKYSALPADQVTFWDYEKYRYVDVDLASGMMSTFEKLGEERGEIYCMKSDELSQLHAILDSADVCEPVLEQVQEGKVCTMLYSYPYASLKTSGSEIRLGERISGCDIPVDLCEEKASQFRNFVGSIVQNLEAHACE